MSRTFWHRSLVLLGLALGSSLAQAESWQGTGEMPLDYRAYVRDFNTGDDRGLVEKYFTTDTQMISGIRRDLQFSETVMRSLVLACEEVPQTAYEPEAAFDVNTIPTEDVPAAPVVDEVADVDVEETMIGDKAEEAKEA